MSTVAIHDQAPQAPTLDALEDRISKIEQRLETTANPENLTILVFSGELDKLLAAFNIANAAAACGTKVAMFFTFWGIASLKSKTVYRNKSLIERAFGFMLPGGFNKRQLSRLDMFGAGRSLMAKEMRTKKVMDLPASIQTAEKLGIELYLCEMTMNLMGIERDELIEYTHKQYCGAPKFLLLARNANTTLFI